MRLGEGRGGERTPVVGTIWGVHHLCTMACIPSQAEDKNFLSISVSEILVIFERGTAHLRWQDPCLLSQLFQLVWSQSPVTLRCFPSQLAPKGMFLQAEIDACA